MQDYPSYKSCRPYHPCKKDCQASCGNNIYIYPPCVPQPEPDVKSTFARTNDRNLTVALTEPGGIPLLSAPELLFEQGGFTMGATNIANDTIIFPDVGVYKLDVNFQYTFLPPTDITLGTFYQVVINMKLDDENLSFPSANSGVTTTDTNQGTLSTTNILNIKNKNARLYFELTNFIFDVSFNKTLDLFLLNVCIVKIADEPLE